MSAGEQILQVQVSLVGASKPLVWRRLVVPATMRLDRLHDVIQVAMGWEDYHLRGLRRGLGDADLRETLADPTHKEHEDMLEWLA